MLFLVIATVAAGLFAGAAIYITAVEHPARLACGAALALRQFGPSYKRATVMQASLAVAGCLAGLAAAWQRQDLVVAAGAALLGVIVPFTLVVILPTNKRLLDPALDPRDPDALSLLRRWGHLHAVRAVLSTAAFLLLLARVVGPA